TRPRLLMAPRCAVCGARGSIDDEVDAHVDAPFGDAAIGAGGDLDLVDPGTLDVLHRLGDLVQALLHGVFDALRRRAAEFDDLGYGHDALPLLEARSL